MIEMGHPESFWGVSGKVWPSDTGVCFIMYEATICAFVLCGFLYLYCFDNKNIF